MNESELAALVHDMGMEVHSHSASHQVVLQEPEAEGASLGRGALGHVGDLPRSPTAASRCSSAAAPTPTTGSGRRSGQARPRRSGCDRRRNATRSAGRISGGACSGLPESTAPNGSCCAGPGDSTTPSARRPAARPASPARSPWSVCRIGPGTDPFRLGRIRVGPTKTARWLRMRLLTYGTAAGARLFSKTFRKKRETKRILYVTDSTKMSGGSRQLLHDVAAMTVCGLDVRVVAPPDTPVASALTGAGAVLVPWDEPRRLIRSARLLARVAREERIDVMHTIHSRPAKSAVLAKLMGGRLRAVPEPRRDLPSEPADGSLRHDRGWRDLQLARGRPRAARQPGSPHAHQRRLQLGGGPRAAGRIRAPGAGLRVLWVGNGNPVKGHDDLPARGEPVRRAPSRVSASIRVLRCRENRRNRARGGWDTPPRASRPTARPATSPCSTPWRTRTSSC